MHPFTGSVNNRWNSTSWDEFARKWNKPVHTFLLRHVYASSISAYRLSKKSAMTFTFILSAAVHELVMAVVTKKIRLVAHTVQSTSQLTHIPCGTTRMYLFALQVWPLVLSCSRTIYLPQPKDIPNPLDRIRTDPCHKTE